MDFSIALDQLSCASPPRPGSGLKGKRILDALLILLALPCLVPLALLVALLIRCGSRGPVLFKQERVGFKGRPFGCFKFRTMFMDAGTAAHEDHLHQLMNSNAPMMKMDAQGDPRIVRFGRLLRASGLDELPQLINVLRGEMSLVGPRPCLRFEFDKHLPWQKARFETMPGLTGLWQVSGKNKTTFVEMIQLDIKYAKRKTLWWDLKIILLTVPALIVQVRETRATKRAASRRDREQTGYSNGATLPVFFPKAALISTVQARDSEDVWKENGAEMNS